MNLIINSSPKDDLSVGIALAQRLVQVLGGPQDMIRLYEEQDGYFEFKFNDQWIERIMNAKNLIIPIAMWNFGVPAAFKDFLDKISKRGKLWELDGGNRMTGLLKDRPVYVIMTSGFEYETGHPNDFVAPYLKAVWASFGIHDVRIFRLGGIDSSRTLSQDDAYLKRRTEEMLRSFGI